MAKDELKEMLDYLVGLWPPGCNINEEEGRMIDEIEALIEQSKKPSADVKKEHPLAAYRSQLFPSPTPSADGNNNVDELVAWLDYWTRNIESQFSEQPDTEISEKEAISKIEQLLRQQKPKVSREEIEKCIAHNWDDGIFERESTVNNICEMLKEKGWKVAK